MYNDDIFSILMAAEESMVKADLGVEDSYEAYAMECALESACYEDDSYGWDAAMEADEGSDAPKSFGDKIKAAGRWIWDGLKKIFTTIWNILSFIPKKIIEAARTYAASKNEVIDSVDPSDSQYKKCLSYYNAVKESEPKASSAIKSRSDILNKVFRNFTVAYNMMAIQDIDKAVHDVKLYLESKNDINLLANIKSKLNELKADVFAEDKAKATSYIRYINSTQGSAVSSEFSKVNEMCKTIGNDCKSFIAICEKQSGKYNLEQKDESTGEVIYSNKTSIGTYKAYESVLYEYSKDFLNASSYFQDIAIHMTYFLNLKA